MIFIYVSVLTARAASRKAEKKGGQNMFYSVLFLASRRSARHFIKLNLIEMNKMCSSFIAFSTSTDFLTPITSQCFLFPHHSRLLRLLIHQTSKLIDFQNKVLTFVGKHKRKIQTSWVLRHEEDNNFNASRGKVYKTLEGFFHRAWFSIGKNKTFCTLKVFTQLTQVFECLDIQLLK